MVQRVADLFSNIIYLKYLKMSLGRDPCLGPQKQINLGGKVKYFSDHCNLFCWVSRQRYQQHRVIITLLFQG